MRRDEEYVGERVIRMDGEGREVEVDGQCKKDMGEKGLSGEDTQNWAAWRQLVRYIDPT